MIHPPFFDEKEVYDIQRKITDIRTRLQLLESEFTYMPIKTIESLTNEISRYQKEVAKLRFMCSEALHIINNHPDETKLF